MKIILSLCLSVSGFFYMIKSDAYIGILVMMLGYILVFKNLINIGVDKKKKKKQVIGGWATATEYFDHLEAEKKRAQEYGRKEREAKRLARERSRRYSRKRTVNNTGSRTYAAVGAASLGVASTSSTIFDDDIFDELGVDNTLDDFAINPATGLMMVGGTGGMDAMGNCYGCDNSDSFGTDNFSSMDDSFSSMDDSFSSMDDSFSSMDDW